MHPTTIFPLEYVHVVYYDKTMTKKYLSSDFNTFKQTKRKVLVATFMRVLKFNMK